MENSWRCTFILLLSITSIAPPTDYTLTNLNPMLDVIKNIYNETHQERHQENLSEESWLTLLSVTLSILLVGAFFGSIIFRFLLNFLTRKQIMILKHALNILGSVIMVLGLGIAGSYEAFIIGRLIVGFTFGLGMSVLPVIVSETCVPNRVDLYGGFIGASFTLGAVIGVIMGWSKVFGTSDRYYGAFLFQLIPSVVYIISAYWIPATPFQAFIKYGEKEARKILMVLRRGNEDDINSEMETLRKEIMQRKSSTRKKDATIVEVLRTPQYRRHFIAIIIILPYIMISGLNNIFFYSDDIFKTAGLDEEVVTPASIGVFSLGVLIAIIGSFLIKKMEPRTMLLIGSCIIIFGHALMTASIATHKSEPVMSIIAIVAMCSFFVGFVLIDIAIFSMVGTLSIDRTRAVCTNIGIALLWFSGWFVGFISSYLKEWLGAYAFLVWMGFSIAAILFIIFFVPTTRGKTSDEIQEFFKTKYEKTVRAPVAEHV